MTNFRINESKNAKRKKLRKQDAIQGRVHQLSFRCSPVKRLSKFMYFGVNDDIIFSVLSKCSKHTSTKSTENNAVLFTRRLQRKPVHTNLVPPKTRLHWLHLFLTVYGPTFIQTSTKGTTDPEGSAIW